MNRVARLAEALDPQHEREGWWEPRCPVCDAGAVFERGEIFKWQCVADGPIYGSPTFRYTGPDLSDPLNMGHLGKAIDAESRTWERIKGRCYVHIGEMTRGGETLFDAACAAFGVKEEA